LRNHYPQTAAPCGSWASPISGELITAGTVGFEQLRLCHKRDYWIERRPTDAGRCVIVEHANGVCRDVLPSPYSARSRVHEYGGGAYCVAATNGGEIFFVNDDDQNIYRLQPGAEPVRITHCTNRRFADLIHDARFNRLICVCENHDVTASQPENTLVAIDLATGDIESLQHGYDFYSNPCLDPDASRLAWLCWNHPHMPWDCTELRRAAVHADGSIGNAETVAGGDGVSVFQPQWSPNGILYFISDESGWWNIRRCTHAGIEQLTHERSEFGLPQWVFGQSSYAFIDDDHLICAHISAGQSRLSLLDIATLQLTPIDTSLVSIDSLRADNGRACFIGTASSAFAAISEFELSSRNLHRIKSSSNAELDEDCLSQGRIISFDSRHNDIVHAIYYAPANREYCPLPDEKPPLIVICHGGPTAFADAALDLRKQFWTSRGFALVDVNYSGSTGFGRAYRERLNGRWGVRDVEDCCDAALYLAGRGLVDASRLIIRGSSAGGYTVLAALTFQRTFAAGASYYGISELESLARDTHKFESHYLDRLVGPYPQAERLYRERSPIHHADSLNCPVIFFQGLEDRVVPPEQAEKMVAALDAKGIAVAYLSFEHEQHGFRQARTILATLDAELYFYAALFGFEAAEKLRPIEIRNLS
jgi:dipeptidyl aminopeptidase/acylaminoacyl peptidase